MAVPMIREGEVVGVMVFSSVRENFFNRLHLYTVEKVASALAGLFFKKKQFKIVSDLSPSVKLFSESTSEIYKYIVEILESYFDSKYVSVWVRKSKSTLEFDLHEATNREFYEKYVQSNFTKRSIKDNKVEEDRLYYVQVVEEYENKNSTIYKFCIAQGFQTYIVINVTMEDDYKVFFNVFSKSPLHGSKFSLEDKIFLEQISRRTRNALQSAAMVRSFINISEGLNKQNLKETLRTIAKSALEVLQADIVTVFPYREGQVIKIEDGEHAGEFSSNFYKKEGRPAYLVNIIAKNGTAWLENTEQYHELLEKNGRFFENEEQRQQSFWHANEIQSLAAVQVRTADQVLGVMCINYRSPRKFQLEEPRKKVIMAFTNLAVSAFLNASTLEQIRKEKQEIEAKHQANAELLEKILPNATRASYWEILEGLNHDIRRGLISLGQATFNITSKIKDLSQKDRTRMGECKAIIDHNTRLVNNLLNLFDFSQTGKTVVNVNKIIKEIIFFFDHRNPNLNFDTKSLLDIPDMKCFKMELSMIWYNLTNNAVWAVQEVGEKHTGIIRFSSAYIDDEYILTIEDNGIGIDNQLKNKIFDLRVTSKQDGLGIGLYIVRETLRNSFQGDISVDSAKGHGAKFTIKIPGYINYID
jgi:signal transduction histidine kinase